MARNDGSTGTTRQGEAGADPSHWARFAARVLLHVMARGGDAERLRREMGLDGVELGGERERIAVRVAYDLVEAAARELDDPDLGLAIASELRPEFFDVVGFVLITSPTLGIALERAERFLAVWSEGERLSLHPAGPRTDVRFTPFGPDRRAHALVAQLFAVEVGVHALALLGVERADALSNVQVRLRARAPHDARAYEALFGRDVEFESPYDEVSLPTEWLARPMPRADEALNAFLGRQAEAWLAEVPDASPAHVPPTTRSRVRALVGARLVDRDATITSVAKTLGATPRTLQRRLEREGARFEELVDDVRRERALALLDSGATIAEIAYLLGYSEPSVFHRAFKRWTGTSPEVLRRGRAE